MHAPAAFAELPPRFRIRCIDNARLSAFRITQPDEADAGQQFRAFLGGLHIGQGEGHVGEGDPQVGHGAQEVGVIEPPLVLEVVVGAAGVVGGSRPSGGLGVFGNDFGFVRVILGVAGLRKSLGHRPLDH